MKYLFANKPKLAKKFKDKTSKKDMQLLALKNKKK